MRRALALLLLVSPLPLPAQETERTVIHFQGRVVDLASGAGVEYASIVVPHLGKGARTNSLGNFVIVDLPYRMDEGELVIEHPCFHSVRVPLRQFFPLERFEIGLPYRTPRMPDGRPVPSTCSAYGPARR